MRVKSLVAFLLCCGIADSGLAVTLHVGDMRVPLSTVRHTSPSLVTMVSDIKYFGALFTDDAPSGALHINFKGTQYWLGEYCAPGTYLSIETGGCADCGFGHYCMGGNHRVACSGGIIGCPGLNATSDMSAPEFSNRILTNDEIPDTVPATDLASHWRRVSCCSNSGDYYYTLKDDLSAINSAQGCANMALQPGTYLFIARSGPGSCNATDPFTGTNGGYFAQMIIFDHAASYKTFHAMDIYYHFVDVDTPEFTDWDFRVPGKAHDTYCYVSFPNNITGLDAVPKNLCVYELR